MTIELITGTPGSGKTTFAVAMRIAPESKRQVSLDEDTCLKLGLDLGTTVTRRVVAAGVRGLKIEHERLPHLLTKDATPAAVVDEWNSMETDSRGKETDVPVHKRVAGEPPVTGIECIVQNWWLWAMPGDLIVVDEAQFLAPRGTLGRKPPFWIQALEIHRHYGVDFIIITQHPGLIDTTIRHLVGLHRHVRSVMGSPVCMVYVWDHASNPERFSLANKTTFVRRAKHYRLFHSSVAHLKPPTSGRSIFILVPLLVALGVGAVAKVRERFVSAKPAPAATAPAPMALATHTAAAQSTRPPGFIDVPKLQGCYSVGPKCTCIGVDQRTVKVEPAMCRLTASSFDGLVQWEPSKAVPPPSPAATPASSPIAGVL